MGEVGRGLYSDVDKEEEEKGLWYDERDVLWVKGQGSHKTQMKAKVPIRNEIDKNQWREMFDD